ncbi:MAG TPA: hypothetical protein VF198_16980 [Vicinamibacterales bacterium]
MTHAGSEAAGSTAGRLAFLPAPTLPLVYFAGSHLALAAAAGTLALFPELPGAFHYHPRSVGLVHLITLGWISGSILGAFYIVAPLALGMPFRAALPDALACLVFWTGTAGMVGGFWTGRYDVVGVAALGVLATIAFVAVRALAGLRRARIPAGVKLHVGLAFANIVAAGALGIVFAFNRLSGDLPWSPLALAIAHGHLAVLGWATMMIFGVAYRLIPMFVPAAMPSARLGVSAVLLEAGTLGLTWSLIANRSALVWVLLVLGAFAAFFVQVRRIVQERRPRPVDLPPRDWSTWQTHTALLYLLVAAILGLWLALGGPDSIAWAYGVAGLLGFVGQMIAGIAGRLLPMHAWYRAMAALDGAPPPVSAHRLIEPRLALAVLVLWSAALPILIAGLSGAGAVLVALGGIALCAGTIANAWHGAVIVARAGRAAHRH